MPFEVLDGGLHTTIQDLGRPGYLATGMPPSGPADRFALGLANLLVGNDPGERYLVGRRPGDAGLEALLFGLKLRVLAETVIAVTGADQAPTLNGEPVPMWRGARGGRGGGVPLPRARGGGGAGAPAARG